MNEKILASHILIVCLWIIGGETFYGSNFGPCTVPTPENISLQLKEIELKGRYPSQKISEYLDRPVNQHFSLLIKQSKSALRFCHTRNTRLKFPNVSSDLKFSRTCPEQHKTLRIPEKVLHNSADCWVLKPWAGYWCGYVDCGMDDCDGVTTIPEVPYPDQFKCRTTNNRLVQVILFCEERKNYIKFYDMRTVTVRLPQCCSCVRFDCTLKG